MVGFMLGCDPLTSHSLANRTLLFDIRREDWSNELLDLAGIEREKLGKTAPGGFVAGTVSEGVAARHAEGVFRRRYIELLRMGMPREEVEENMTRLRAEAEEQSKRDLRLQFILDRAADKLEIEISDGDLNSMIASMASQYERRPEKMRQELESDGSLEQVRISMREDAALDKMLEEAEIVEVAVERPEKKPEAKGEAKAEESAKKSAKKAAKKSEKKKTGDEAGGQGEAKAKKTAKKTAAKAVKKTAKKAVGEAAKKSSDESE